MFLFRTSRAIVCAAFFLVNPAAKAADLVEMDLTGSLIEVLDYNNVTINNTRTLSSAATGFILFDGTVDGDINITNSGSITSTFDINGAIFFYAVGNNSSQKTVSITNSGSLISELRSNANTIYIGGKDDGAGRRSFDFVLDNTGTISTEGTAVHIDNNTDGTFDITNSGTINSSHSLGTQNVISLLGGASGTISNTGIITANSASEVAIETDAASGVINNTGSGAITGIINADGGSATQLAVNNNSSVGITGNITTTNADLDVTNTSGTITGNIILGDHASSSLAINGGTVSGNVTMGNAAQRVTFGGGVLNGTINGAGGIDVNENITTNGHIGASTSLTSITVAALKTLNAADHNNSIRATNIILNSGSTLTMGDGALSAAVDGSGTNRGIVNLNFSADATVSATLGASNGLAEVNVNADEAVITVNNIIKASEVNISGVDGALILTSSSGINGNAVIGDNSTLSLTNGASVSGTIRALNNGEGIFQIENNTTLTAAGEIGTSLHHIGNFSIGDHSSLTTAYAIRSSYAVIGSDSTLTTSSAIIGNLELNSNSVLNLQNGSSVTGNIGPGGIVDVGTINTSGTVTISGEIGSGGPIAAINVSNASQLSISNNDGSHANSIEVLNIDISGQLNLIDATSITGDVAMIGSSSKINLSGYSHSINGNFTTASGSTIAATIHSSSVMDKLTVSGAATINSGTKLALSIDGVTPGSSYVLIDGGSGSSISAISNSNITINGDATNRFGRYIFSTLVSGSDLLLSSSVAATLNATGNRGGIYNNITNADVSSGALFAMQEYIFGDASDGSKNAALDSVLPEVDNAANRSILNSANISFDLASTRMQSLYSTSGIASGDEAMNKNRSFWVQAFGSNVSQGRTSLSEGYKSDIRGLAFGVDKEISDNSLLGISGSYSNSFVKSRSALKTTSINSYQINAYGGYHVEDYFINGLAGFVWNDYDSSRYIPVVAGRAAANYHGQTYIARAEAGMMQQLQDGFIFTPLATVTMAHNKADDYSESGAGTLSLAVRNKSANFFETRGGIALKKIFKLSDYVVVPEIFASYGYDFAASKQRTSSNFVGQTSTFDASASNIARGSFKSGISTKIYSQDALSFNLDYVYEKRLDYHANSAALKAAYKF